MTTTHGELFADIDRLDAHAWATHLAPEAVLRFANAAPVHGREACETAAARWLARLESVTHDTLEQWQHGNATIVEASLTCRRSGRPELMLPVVTIFRENQRHLISDYRVYVDTTPLRD